MFDPPDVDVVDPLEDVVVFVFVVFDAEVLELELPEDYVPKDVPVDPV